jgi:hypothetical protein
MILPADLIPDRAIAFLHPISSDQQNSCVMLFEISPLQAENRFDPEIVWERKVVGDFPSRFRPYR